MDLQQAFFLLGMLVLASEPPGALLRSVDRSVYSNEDDDGYMKSSSLWGLESYLLRRLKDLSINPMADSQAMDSNRPRLQRSVTSRSREKRQYYPLFLNSKSVSYGISQSPDVSHSKKVRFNKTKDYNTGFLKFGNRGKVVPKDYYIPERQTDSLGKRRQKLNQGLKYIRSSKWATKFDPAIKLMGLGKRDLKYTPAWKFIGLGKRESESDSHFYVDKDDIALKFNGRNKKFEKYNPSLKLVGLGKRKPSVYDPAFKMMGLGKRGLNFNSDLQLSNSEKQSNNHMMKTADREENPKISLQLENASLESPKEAELRHDDFSSYRVKRQTKLDPGLRFLGLGKRNHRMYPPLLSENILRNAIRNEPNTQWKGFRILCSGKGRATYNDFGRNSALTGLKNRVTQHRFPNEMLHYPKSVKWAWNRYPITYAKAHDDVQSYSDEDIDSSEFLGVGEPNYAPEFSALNMTRLNTRQLDDSNIQSNVAYHPPFLVMDSRESKHSTRIVGVADQGKRKDDGPPKYDPGWKFIGLGKRQSDDGNMFSGQVNYYPCYTVLNRFDNRETLDDQARRIVGLDELGNSFGDSLNHRIKSSISLPYQSQIFQEKPHTLSEDFLGIQVLPSSPTRLKFWNDFQKHQKNLLPLGRYTVSPD